MHSQASSIEELQEFLKFLKGSPGEIACLFWMDVERMKIAALKQTKRELLLRLKSLYVISSAPMTLEGGMREDIIAGSRHMTNLDEEIQSWTTSQESVIDSLRHYWLKAFHSQHPWYSYQQLPAVQSASRTEVTDNCNGSQDNEMKDALLHKQDSYSCIKNLPRTNSNRVELSPCIQMFPTQSTCQLFKKITSKSKASCYQRIGSRWQCPKHNTLVPYLEAALCCNMAAGCLITDYFKKTQPNATAVCLLQFWQSVETIFTMEKMRDPCNVQPCHPYLVLLDSRPLATDLQTLTDLFIASTAPFHVDIPHELLKELEYLLPKGLGDDLLLKSQELASDVSLSLFI